MIEFLAIFIALAGTLIASYYDLKTTEIPDYLPIVMIAAGILLNLVNFLITKNSEYLFLSIMNGIVFSAIGFSMYFAGQWGAGDAFLLAAVGFLIPKNFFLNEDFPFLFTYLVNLFFLGSIYMIIYSIAYAIREKTALKYFKEQMSKFYWAIFVFFIFFLIASSIISYLIFNSINLKLVIISTISSIILIILWVFSKSVEKSFIKRIPVSKLKVGDVLVESKRWDGITEKKLREIKRSGKKYVYIKTGVCFAPAFPIALIYTFLFGNSVINFIKLLYLI
jgi:Flp pilus assembly protein protease CpaA